MFLTTQVATDVGDNICTTNLQYSVLKFVFLFYIETGQDMTEEYSSIKT